MAGLTTEVAHAIFESLGGDETPLTEKIAMAEKIISCQKSDIGKLELKLHGLDSSQAGQDKKIEKLKEKMEEVYGLLEQLLQWQQSLDIEEEALKREIVRLEAAREPPAKHST